MEGEFEQRRRDLRGRLRTEHDRQRDQVRTCRHPDAERNDGAGPEESIYKACLLRFRPIMMTTMAAMFGGIPMAFSRGNGAELRRPLGIAMVGGLLVSQVLTLYTTPIIYIFFDRIATRFSGKPHATAADPNSGAAGA